MKTERDTRTANPAGDLAGPVAEGAARGKDTKAALRGRGYDEQVQMLTPEGAPGAKAELQRLSETMTMLAQKNAWTGVERTYQQILGLGVAPSGDVHKLGADAARSTGDVREQQMRLRRAKAAGLDVSADLEALERAFGTVRIDRSGGGRKKKKEDGPDLTPDEVPFAPDLRAAIEKAQAALKATGSYSGLLPAGGYTVGSRPFRVFAGASAQVQYEPG